MSDRIEYQVAAQVWGSEPPANSERAWEMGGLIMRRLAPSADSTDWRLLDPALLAPESALADARAIVERAFGAERVLSVGLRRVDGEPLPGAQAKTREFLAQRGELDAIEGKI